jgi:hypothetical protein
MADCLVEGCGREAVAHGLCATHRKQVERRGRIMPVLGTWEAVYAAMSELYLVETGADGDPAFLAADQRFRTAVLAVGRREQDENGR